MLFDCILLIHFKHIKAERSEAAIFHILKGNKSIQTVQDIHIYKLEKFYGTGNFLSKIQFDTRVETLRTEELLKKQDRNNHYAVTEKGLNWLKNQSHVPINYFNGFRYHQIAVHFHDRLILLIQTLTNSKMNNFSFIPVISNQSTENWVRSFYRKTSNRQQEILGNLYKELSQLLSYGSEEDSEIFVDRLSGYNVYGHSINQLAAQHQLENEDIYFILTGIIHHMISIVENQANTFPLMSHIMQGLKNNSNLSNSAKITKRLLNENYTISQIANQRQLKDNTIHDHIVEIAYNDDQFPVAHFVPENKQETILKAINYSPSYKLKQIKNNLGDEFSYFEIRLILAAYRNIAEIGDKDARKI